MRERDPLAEQENLRVDDSELNDVQVLDGDCVAHSTVNSLVRSVRTHAEGGEQAWHLGHLVSADTRPSNQFSGPRLCQRCELTCR